MFLVQCLSNDFEWLWKAFSSSNQVIFAGNESRNDVIVYNYRKKNIIPNQLCGRIAVKIAQ